MLEKFQPLKSVTGPHVLDNTNEMYVLFCYLKLVACFVEFTWEMYIQCFFIIHFANTFTVKNHSKEINICTPYWGTQLSVTQIT